VKSVRNRRQSNVRLMVESAAFGLGYTAVLIWAGSALVASFSKYLQLNRRSAAPVKPVVRTPGVTLVQAVAETAVVLATGLVTYLSVNAVTHPWTLTLQLTHLWPWPSEGTVRVLALGICLVAVATSRYLRATASRPSQTATVPETANDKAGVSA
jgi:hypothetical protein